MKPVQYAQVSYFAHFRDYFCYFEINGYFHFFIWGGEGAVEVILEGFICEIESFHIIYFYFF